MSCPYLMSLWYDLAGKHYPEYEKVPDLNVLKTTEWSLEFENYLAKSIGHEPSPEFIQYMKNRLLLGAFRYGLMKHQDYGRYDMPKYIKTKLSLFASTNNLEPLVDAANLCLIAYVHYTRTGSPLQNEGGIIKYYNPYKYEEIIATLEKTYNPAYAVVMFIHSIIMPGVC
jgi:hypothetical protein